MTNYDTMRCSICGTLRSSQTFTQDNHFRRNTICTACTGARRAIRRSVTDPLRRAIRAVQQSKCPLCGDVLSNNPKLQIADLCPVSHRVRGIVCKPCFRSTARHHGAHVAPLLTVSYLTGHPMPDEFPPPPETFPILEKALARLTEDERKHALEKLRAESKKALSALPSTARARFVESLLGES